MKIIILADHAYINGGQSKVAIESALGLVGRGHRVTFFAATGPADERLTAAGVEVVCLGQMEINVAAPKATDVARFLWNDAARRWLAETLAVSDPSDTVVHVHAWAKGLSASIGPAIAASDAPCVYTLHELFIVCPNGGLFDYQQQTPCLRTPMSANCVTAHCDSRSYAHKALRLVRHGLLQAGGLGRNVDHFITISDLQEQVAAPWLPKQAMRHRVDNPIDTPDLGPKTAPGEDFVFVGRLSPEKGVAHFCEAARRAGVQPVIAGDGPLFAELKAQYPEAKFLGWLNPAQVRAFVRDARALVFPSVNYEGQPLTVHEALALGTPVIVSDACAGRESVRHGETGLWFKSADVGAMAEALTRLRDEPTATSMAKAAYERYWAAPLTVERHVAEIEKIYVSAVAGRRKAAA